MTRERELVYRKTAVRSSLTNSQRRHDIICTPFEKETPTPPSSILPSFAAMCTILSECHSIHQHRNFLWHGPFLPLAALCAHCLNLVRSHRKTTTPPALSCQWCYQVSTAFDRIGRREHQSSCGPWVSSFCLAICTVLSLMKNTTFPALRSIVFFFCCHVYRTLSLSLSLSLVSRRWCRWFDGQTCKLNWLPSGLSLLTSGLVDLGGG